MPEPADEELSATPRNARADRAESVATLVALGWASAVAIIFAVSGGSVSLVGLLAISPFLAAGFARPSRVALVGILTAFFALVISTPVHSYGELNHTLRVVTMLAATAVAMWISYLRGQRNVQLWAARSETRNERRRRVAAETAQRMQTMARALTTAADPAQVADAVFAAMRDELRVDASTFALLDERGVLQTLRRFGYAPEDPIDGVLNSLQIDGPVLGHNVAFFSESIDDLRRDRPDIYSSLHSGGFRALAIIPLVVSDHTIGAVVVHWVRDREIAEPERTFLFTITGAAAQAVERARLTLTEFVNLERTQHLHQLSSALAAAATPGDVAHAAIAGGRRALGAQSAVVRVPAAGERSLACLASSGHPALLSRTMVPIQGSHAGACFTRGLTVMAGIADGHVGENVETEVVARVLQELPQPVTVVSEPLIGSVGPLGVLSLAFAGQPEPSEPDLRFLSTLAGLTAQALERAQVFEHEREALRDAEAGRERLSLLSEVTRLLSSSLEPTTVIRRTMSLVEGRLADSCSVQVPGDHGLVRLDVREPRPASQQRAGADGGGRDVLPFGSDAPAAVAFRTGRTQLAPLHDDEGGDDQPGVSTALSVPLTANGEVIGVMTFVDGPGRAFEADDVSLATEVASRAGVALSNATRFQREHVVADVLQRAVLPDSLPDVEGLLLDAEYQAGVAGTYAGGDWYDVFELNDDCVFFSVGDVMGKGAPAAALMGQVRSAIRAYAVSGQSPTEVLSSLDRLFDTLIEDRVVTAVVGTISPSTGRVVLSNAGHPPPLVVRADGTATFCPMQRTLLIAAGLSGSLRPRDEVVLDRGDSLVMYSDGLIERRGEVITHGMERLANTATSIARAGWPDHPAITLASMLSVEERPDDIVVLCVNYTGTTAGRISAPAVGTSRDGMSTLHLEPVVESTPVARHWVSAHLRDLPAEVTGCAALLTSELITNAVLHAATPMCITLHTLPDRIRIDVADGNPAFPSIKEYGKDAATGRGLTLFNTLASNWGVQAVDGGKIVWFELPVDFPVSPSSISDGSFRFDLTGITHPSLHGELGASQEVSVRLLGIPVTLLQKSSEEYEALFRELRLMKERTGISPETPHLPERLSVLVSQIGTRFNGLGPGMDDMWQSAVDNKVDFFDWTLDLPQSAVAAVEFYDTLLDEADEFGLARRLLTLPASPPSVAVRRWFLSELIGQLHGKAPVAWVDSRFHDELQAVPAR
ncbi:MAG TPA: SpoIIE family protein phosphatase [Acidimicrobiales bacterium]|nr:SpoIIE family protein phosphatase [Acidimicrobiales bacterium]